MGILDGKVAVVAGGTGSVGEGIVHSFLNDGATVVVPTRSEGKRDRLAEYVGEPLAERLVCIPAFVGEEESVGRLRTQVISRFERVDIAVATIGDWYYGYSLHHMPFADWQRVLNDNLNTHFLFMRAFLSLFHQQKHGTYIMLNGGASEIVAPEAGVISIVAAAQKMMAKVLDVEARGTAVRVYSIVAFNPLKTRVRDAQVVDEWLSAEEVGTYMCRLAVGSAPRSDEPIHTLHTRRDL